MAVEGHRHRPQRRALLLPDLDDLATGLLRMVALACQLQTARSEMRIEFGQIRATYLRREQPLAHVADLVLDPPPPSGVTQVIFCSGSLMSQVLQWRQF